MPVLWCRLCSPYLVDCCRLCWLTSCRLVCQVFAGLELQALILVSQVGCAHPTGCWLWFDGSYRTHSWVILSTFCRCLQTAVLESKWIPVKCSYIFQSMIQSQGSTCRIMSHKKQTTEHKFLRANFSCAVWQLSSFPWTYWITDQNEYNYRPEKGCCS